jgi:hypothetical protein
MTEFFMFPLPNGGWSIRGKESGVSYITVRGPDKEAKEVADVLLAYVNSPLSERGKLSL